MYFLNKRFLGISYLVWVLFLFGLVIGQFWYSRVSAATIFTENFDLRTVGDIDGQNGWQRIGGTFNVAATTTGNDLHSVATHAAATNEEVIVQESFSLLDTHVQAKVYASTTSGVTLWLRKASATTTSGLSYILHQNGGFLNIGYYSTASLFNLARVKWAPVSGAPYIFEFQVDSSSGYPRLSVWAYAATTTRPTIPLLEYSDIENLVPSAGYVGVGDVLANVIIDDFVVSTPVSTGSGIIYATTTATSTVDVGYDPSQVLFNGMLLFILSFGVMIYYFKPYKKTREECAQLSA